MVFTVPKSNWTVPDWIVEALSALRPPGKMTVSEWADKYRILDSRTSALPGRWRTDYTPYLRSIMNAFTDHEVEEIIVVKPTQVGGTEVILNMMGYAISQDPSSAMVVYPTDTLGESISQNRIQPMIDTCPELRNRYDPNSKRLELQFAGMYLAIAGANSPSSLASRPIRFLFLDEVDKYPSNAGKEASPRALAKERTKAYSNSRKIVEVSTPTFEDAPIWQDWLSADTQYRYYVTCPDCGDKWTFKFKQLKWEGETPEEARNTAFYVCENCGCLIKDNQKTEMIKQGEWLPIKENGKRRVAYQFNTFLSPTIRLGDIAYEFMNSKHIPELLQNFINSWLGEPYKQIEGAVEAEYLLKERQSAYQEYEVPPGTLMLTGGVDVQKKCFYWTIRAWMPNMTSYNLAHGKAYSWQEISNIMNSWFADRNGKRYMVNLAAIDSGDQTDDVYNYCAINREWAVPVKGASNPLDGKYRLTRIDKIGSIASGMLLCFVDTGYYKDMILGRLHADADHGGWYLHDNCDPGYAEMICSEQKVTERFRGRLVSRWKTKQIGADNHYLDCEVYAACAADLCGLRTFSAEQAQQSENPQAVAEAPQQTMQPTAELPMTGQKQGYFKKKSRWRR